MSLFSKNNIYLKINLQSNFVLGKLQKLYKFKNFWTQPKKISGVLGIHLTIRLLVDRINSSFLDFNLLVKIPNEKI